MRKLMTREWLLSAAAMLGVASSTYAQDMHVQRAEAIFNSAEPSLVQQIGGESCDPCNPGCDFGCDDGCLSDECDSCYLFPGEFDLGSKLFCEDSGWDLGGWTQFGFHTDNDGVFNTHPGTLDLQQFNIYLEKVADGSNGIGFGGRVDIMYGTDAQNTQAFGNNPGRFDYLNGWDHGIYGFAMPQLYGEVAIGDLSIKAGHFYTLLGYQVVPATGNFFYSIPYTFNFSEAFTHTGVLATYTASDNVTLYGGWTLGWDTGFDQLNQGNSFLGGSSVSVTDDLTVTYILTAGNLGWIGEGYTHSIVADWTINDKWEYVFQSDMVGVDTPTNAGGGHYDTVGVNQYLFYTVSDCTKLGARVEWWKADGQSLYEMAYGVNYYPMKNLRLRPEIRHNWTPNGAFAGTPFDNTTVFGMDAIFTF